jgi:glutamine cyclotransferase
MDHCHRSLWLRLLRLTGIVVVLACAAAPAMGEGYGCGSAEVLVFIDGVVSAPPRLAASPDRDEPAAGAGSVAALRSLDPEDGQHTQLYTYEVIQEYPHDAAAFTQGLVFTDGVLYEGTGWYGASSLRRVELETGTVLQIHDLPSQYFGEGITVWGDQINQLTWKAGIAFVYDKTSFGQEGTFSYATEGWGITHDGTRLIMSDGTATLYFRDPASFDLIGQVQVHDVQGPVLKLNELEYIQGWVFANVWLTDRIVIIDPQTGWVAGSIDLTGLLSPEDSQGADVLNGIAYDVVGDRLFVTGKWWPKLFEIELIPVTFLPLVLR